MRLDGTMFVLALDGQASPSLNAAQLGRPVETALPIRPLRKTGSLLKEELIAPAEFALTAKNTKNPGAL